MSAWSIEWVESSNGVTDAKGFRASGVSCDIRGKGNGQLDIGMVYSSSPCAVAGTFTSNRVKAAPVLLDQSRVRSGRPVHGVIANSGNANACTGDEGYANAEAQVALAEGLSGRTGGSFLVCSTGRIGRQMPMDKVKKGIHAAWESLGDDDSHGHAFSQCILTSDTRPKRCGVILRNGAREVRIAACAKGAGMIRPDMATMLAFIVTDLGCEQADLQSLLSEAVEDSFNSITVDGDMSTNDTVLLLANGASGVSLDAADAELRSAFLKGLSTVCERLAYLIVGDGEKISKVVTVKIVGAPDRESARKVAYSIAHSALVKSSWAGSDPNWGRVLCAAGYSGLPVKESDMSMYYDACPVVKNGRVLDENLSQWREIVSKKEFSIVLDIGMGHAEARLLASDLTPEYIEFNMHE